MAADSELEILIRLLADTKGADAVQQALDKTKGATGELGKATDDLGKKTEDGAKQGEKFEISHRAIHQILHLIGTESGPAAGAALSGLAAAGTGSVLILIMAFRELFELMKQNAEAAKELAQTISSGVDNADFIKGLDDMKRAMLEAKDQADDFEGALSKIESAQDSLLSKAQTAIGLIQQEMAADLAKAEAKKKAVIEEIKANEALGKISKTQAESDIADVESKSEKEANERKQRARKSELDQLHLAEKRNRDEFPDAKAEAEAADKAREQAEQNQISHKNLVEQAKAALDESKDGSVASQLKKKQEALDEIPIVSQHDYVFGQKDDADNLKVEIESLTRLKNQAEEHLKTYGTVGSEHQNEKALKDAQQKASEAEDRAKKLDEENNALTKKISDLHQANAIATDQENTTAQYNDQARGQQNIQRRATEDRSQIDKGISTANRDIDIITHSQTQRSGSAEEMQKARAAVTELHQTLSQLPALLSDLKNLGANTQDLQRQIDALKGRTDRPRY